MSISTWLSMGPFLLAAIGLSALVAQYGCLLVHFRGARRQGPGATERDLEASSGLSAKSPHAETGFSILKPLCGLDEELFENIASFAALRHPAYEVLLGVRSPGDPAFPVARLATQRWPDRMRLVIQQSDEGLNPKVNQLIGLSKAARYPALVVSDSNVRVRPDYLTEISACLADPSVGLVTHPVVGVGERRLGSLFENLHLAGSVAPGIVAAHRLAHREIVVGKSMALWKADVERLGGFRAVKDVLAEDHVLGVYVRRRLRKRVVVARQPVLNVNRDRRVRDFWGRYARWAVLQRQILGSPTYAVQVLLNPVLLGLAGLSVSPGSRSLLLFMLICAAKVAVDAGAARTLRRGGFPLLSLLLIPVKDLLFGTAMLQAFLRDEVEWRGNRLRVLRGSRIAPPEEEPVPGVVARA